MHGLKAFVNHGAAPMADMRAFILFLVMASAGCASSSGPFAHAPRQEALAGGDRFVLRRQGNRAQAIRVNPRPFPTFPSVAANAAQAAFESSGCVADWIVGDPSLVEMGLRCGQEPAPPPPRGQSVLTCDLTYAREDAKAGLNRAELVCRPI